MKKLTLRQLEILEGLALREIAQLIKRGEPVDRSLSIARSKLTEGIQVQREAQARKDKKIDSYGGR